MHSERGLWISSHGPCARAGLTPSREPISSSIAETAADLRKKITVHHNFGLKFQPCFREWIKVTETEISLFHKPEQNYDSVLHTSYCIYSHVRSAQTQNSYVCIPKNADNSLISWATTSFSTRTVLKKHHDVVQFPLHPASSGEHRKFFRVSLPFITQIRG